MPSYVAKVLTQFHHEPPKRQQDSPYLCAPTKYGAKAQYTEQPKDRYHLTKQIKKIIQQVTGKFLFLGRAVDSTLLTPLSATASQQATPTEATLEHTKQFLDYMASQEDAVLTYHASNMILVVPNNAGYHSKLGARSRAGGHFFLSTNDDIPPNNGAILGIAQIIKAVMTSAAEAEVGALFINTKEAVNIRNILQEMGHL